MAEKPVEDTGEILRPAVFLWTALKCARVPKIEKCAVGPAFRSTRIVLEIRGTGFPLTAADVGADSRMPQAAAWGTGDSIRSSLPRSGKGERLLTVGRVVHQEYASGLSPARCRLK